jgi:hypothetical protein
MHCSPYVVRDDRFTLFVKIIVQIRIVHKARVKVARVGFFCKSISLQVLCTRGQVSALRRTCPRSDEALATARAVGRIQTAQTTALDVGQRIEGDLQCRWLG